MGQPIKTYIIAGDDHNGAFSGLDDAYANHPDALVIHPERGKSLKETLEKAFKEHPIEGSANVIIAAHGVENHQGVATGEITWKDAEDKSRKDNEHIRQDVTYSEVFKALPKHGIASVSVTSCFGGKSEEYLHDVPKGAILQSLVGDKTPGTSDFITEFGKESAGLTKPVDIMLKALDNTDANALAENLKQDKDTVAAHLDPNNVLPHTVGIGGGERINLDNQVKAIQEKGTHGTLNKEAYRKAIEKVQYRFDTNNGNHGAQGAAAEKALDNHVAEVAHKLESGQPPKDLEEQRISFALAIAYMDETGDLEKRIRRARGEPEVQHAPHHTAPQQTAPQTPKVSPLPPASPPPHSAEPSKAPENAPEKHAAKPQGELAKLYNGISRNEVPAIQQDQVKALQERMAAGGENLGQFGADGMLGKDTLKAMQDVAKKAGVDLHSVNFSDPNNAATRKFNAELDALKQEHGKGKTAEAAQQQDNSMAALLQKSGMSNCLASLGVGGGCHVESSQAGYAPAKAGAQQLGGR